MSHAFVTALAFGLAAADSPAAAQMAAEPGYIAVSEIETVHRSLVANLPEPLRAALVKRFPAGRVIASCAGSFSRAGAEERAVTVLDGPVLEGAAEGPVILREVLTADGSLVDLPWAEGPAWSVSAKASVEDGRLFFGELKCLPGGQAQTLAKGFLPGFIQKKAAKQVNLTDLGSVCFSFDDTYNNWQCFAYCARKHDFVRWGFQATAD